MNWMTSGRKRVQRSQKAKELRAKHFAKVAADRARAPLSQPVRTINSKLRQSADVSRLKSRWTQQPSSAHAAALFQRATPDSSTAEHEAAVSPSLASAVTPMESASTLDFQPGMLDLEATPPFHTAHGQPRGGNGGGSDVVANRAAASLSSDSDGTSREFGGKISFERPFRQYYGQRQPAEISHGRSVQLRAQPHDCLPHPTVLPLQRRQLAFGGRECMMEQQECEEGYEEQSLGGEGAGVDHRSEAPAATRHRRGRMPPLDGAAVGGNGGNAGDAGSPESESVVQRGHVGGEMGHQMRFFNDGLAVAQDGSPMAGAPVASSPSTTAASSSAGRTAFPANGHDDSIDATNTPFGRKESGNVGGLPSFARGRVLRDDHRSPATASWLWEETLPPRGLESFASDRRPEFSRRIVEEFGKPGYPLLEDVAELRRGNVADVGQDHVLRERGSISPPRDQAPAALAFEALARTWGLFGGALETAAPTASSALGDADVENRESVEEGGACYRSFRQGHDELEGAAQLHVGIPLRATPYVAGLGDHWPEPNGPDVENRDGSWHSLPQQSQQSPIPLLGEGYDRGREDGSGSPELTMQFVQESKGEDPGMVAAGGQADAEASEGGGKGSQPGTSLPALTLTIDGVQESSAQQAASSAELASQGSLAAATVCNEEQRPRQAQHETLPTIKESKSVADDIAVAPASTKGDHPLTEGQQAPLRQAPLRPGQPPFDPVNADTLGGRRDGDGGGGGSEGKPSDGRDDGCKLSSRWTQASGDCVSAVDVQARPSAVIHESIGGAGHDAAQTSPSSSPDDSAAAPSAAAGLNEQHKGAASSSSQSKSQKRARGKKEKKERQAQGGANQSEDAPMPQVLVCNCGGVVEARLTKKARRLEAIVTKAAEHGSGGGEGGEGEGSVRDGGAHRGSEEGDSYSTIVWYKTIVACLTAAY